MAYLVSRYQIVRDCVDRFERMLEVSVTGMLMSKHLYQQCELPHSPGYFLLNDDDDKLLAVMNKSGADDIFIGVAGGPWVTRSPEAFVVPGQSQKPDPSTIQPTLRADTVKLMCTSCNTVEAHNCSLNRTLPVSQGQGTQNTPVIQEFVFSFTCQACKRSITTFLVRREDFKLSIAGRSPMETIDIERFVPRAVTALFRSAILADHCSQTLASICLLRITIEQHVRQSTKYEGEDIDELFEAYSRKLPKTVREEYPSLRSAYEQLSDAIHGAKEDREIFEEAKNMFLGHCEALDLYQRRATALAGSKSDLEGSESPH